MTRPRHFQITYRFSSTRRLFIQPDSHMTDEDAWYYACLHAGVGLVYGSHDDPEQLRANALDCGLTQVVWEELP